MQQFKNQEVSFGSNHFGTIDGQDLTPQEHDLCDVEEITEDEMNTAVRELETEVSTDVVHAYLNDIGRYPLLSDKEEAEAFIRLGNGDRSAKDLLVNANLRLVVSVARRFQGRGLSMGDMIQEGNIGLMKAVDKFDYTLGFKFSTYATWWVRQSITRAIADTARTIRIPVHMVEMINKLSAVKKTLTLDLGREPTVSELAEELDLPERKVKEILEASGGTVSLDKPVGEEEDSRLGDFLPDDNAADPFEHVSHAMLRKNLDSVLETLTERERMIIIERYGYDGERPKTLEEIGAELGVTRERVRQIESGALRKLRHPSRSRWLKDYLAS